MDLYHSIYFTVFFFGILLIAFVNLVVGGCSWSLVNRFDLLCLGLFLNHWRLNGCGFLFLLWAHVYWTWRCLEWGCVQLLQVLSFSLFNIGHGCRSALRFILFTFLLLLNDLTSINFESNLHKCLFTFAVVKKFKRFSVTFQNLCSCL